MATRRLKVGVVGAGWAGLAAAVESTRRGHAVTLFEMSAEPGGRARRVPGAQPHGDLDNGQHILIGAYTETLALMRQVGVDPDLALQRRPLCLAYPDGSGLVLPPGPAVPAFMRAVLGQRRWRLADRLGLLRAAVGWRLSGFRCPPEMSVAELCRSLSPSLRSSVIDPLCVAALNTPSEQASAVVFLRVVRDALFSGPGAADLLLPTQRLSGLLPAPAWAWLQTAGATMRVGRRVRHIEREPGAGLGWRVDDAVFDRVIVATPSTEAARLMEEVNPGWAAITASMRHEPIITIYLMSPGTRLDLPMLALHSDAVQRPAQFVFDQGQLGGPDGLLALVISGAAPWVDRGQQATLDAATAQLHEQLGAQLKAPASVVRLLTDKRATFRCTPGLQRPAMFISKGLLAAGDYIDGPYPATLEGAVRSGLSAARSF